MKQDPVDYFIGTVGGMTVKIKAKGMNVMSKAQFRKLRADKHKYLTADKGEVIFAGVQFVGMFTAEVKIKGVATIVNFYVDEGDNEFVTVNKCVAEKLHIGKENA